MKLVVGLGNPGPEYADTRHNVGVRVLERLASRHGIALDAERFDSRFGAGRIGAGEVALLAPQTYMNRSGAAVVAALDGLGVDEPADDLWVVFDDVDLPFGRLRLRPSGGAGGHRGLADVILELASPEFPRLRVGVGRPPEGDDTAEHVLEPFSAEEREHLPELLGRACDALEHALRDGVTVAMNAYNRDPAPEPAENG